MRDAERIREFAADTYITPARRRGAKTVSITAGDVHTALRLQNVVPNVVQALKGQKFLKRNQLDIESIDGPPSGVGPKLTITYRLLGEQGEVNSSDDLPLMRLYGAGKEVFKSLGGGEAFIRHERENFYGDREEP